ncbi:MAG TPA: glycosyltransferase family 87 protein [Rhizomicrobium sp.]|jgi:hypothetical protein|nr:glycosyltransferase family 87 protein [Rhizomicrobium sp.]
MKEKYRQSYRSMMLSKQPTPAPAVDNQPTVVERVITLTMAGLAVAYIAGLIIAVALHLWPYDRTGHPVMTDFLVFWISGHLALHGAAHVAYVEHLLHLAEVQTVGHGVPARLPWSYPPLFLCVAVVLASLPFALSFALWNCVTFISYTGVMAAITKRPAVALAAAACPWATVCLYIGQEGLFSASIVGGTLLLLNRRPAMSGLLLGLLSFKPQLGILFPVALAFGGYWRAMAWACAATLAWTAASSSAFGFSTLLDFFHGLASATDSFLIRDGIGWYNFQSVYALSRWFGAPGAICWTIQAIASIAGIGGIAALWRSNCPFSLKAAGLAAAIPLAVPYVFVYDQCVLGVAFGFLIRQRRLDIFEYSALMFMFLITSFAWSKNPMAALATVAACVLVVRRALLERRDTSRTMLFDAEPVSAAQPYAA